MNGSKSAWTRPDFRRLWWGQTISEFGTLLGAVSLLAVLVLDATPTQMGLLGVMGTAPALLLGLPAGVWLDHLPRKPFLIASDLLRAAALMAIAILALTDQLTFALLLPLAFLIGCGNVIFHIAHESLLPTLLPAADLVDGNSKLGASSSVAESISPALGGILVDLISAPFTILIDALSFIISALFIRQIEQNEKVADKASLQVALWTGIKVGLQAIVTTPLLRSLTGFQLLRNFFGSFIGATYTLWVIRELGLSPTWLGIIVGSGGIGAVSGALLVGRLTGRFHLGRLILLTSFIHIMFIALIPLAGGPIWLAVVTLIVAQIAGDLFQTVFEISIVSLRQSITPPELMGRINASFQVLGNSATMLGLIVGGLLATSVNIPTALWCAFAGIVASYGWLWWSPLKSISKI